MTTVYKINWRKMIYAPNLIRESIENIVVNMQLPFFGHAMTKLSECRLKKESIGFE